MMPFFDLSFRAIFEAIPVIGAVVCVLICGKAVFFLPNSHHRHLCSWATFNSLLMLYAQSSWMNSLVIEKSLIGTELANHIWTIHNSSWVFLAIYATLNNEEYLRHTGKKK